MAHKENHHPLLNLLIRLQDPKPRRENFDLTLQQYENLPPLYLVLRMNSDTVEALLTLCNLHQKDINGRTLPHPAAYAGLSEYDNYLGLEKVKLEATDSERLTAPATAVSEGHSEGHRASVCELEKSFYILGLLLEHKTMRDVPHSYNASVNGRAEVIHLLIDAGAKFQDKYYLECTALMASAKKGSPAGERQLVAYGANTNTSSTNH
ncbi:hypothetical protein K469DRAFT_696630 [Zopfia rhizophila CBS 207.26]|uniref:Uncharacterized protein n=1 Tax=Zopfia rhizophila CBS 207.26 TaxID=1314779 RepID=A0A6A6DIR7_9PEZI|nr:hypothetical protein K469DRAFT_696630 [Zopfia rhizophila CBS 207.26]